MLTSRQSMRRIQDKMTEQGLSLTALSERTGVARDVYKTATAAGEHLSVDVLGKVAEALGVSVAWIIGESNHPSRETSYQISLTPRPVQYEEIRVARRENGEVSMQIIMDDRIADFNFYPETVGRLIAEFTAALRDPISPPISAAEDPPVLTEHSRDDTIEFIAPADEPAPKIDYSYSMERTG